MALVYTSVCHHCTSAHMAPVVQALLNRLDQPASSSSSTRTTPPSRQTAIFPIVATLLFTRKGKRYPDQLLKPTMQKLLDLSADLDNQEEAWNQGYLRVLVGVLMASKLEHWLSPGVMLIEKVWRSLVRMAPIIHFT